MMDLFEQMLAGGLIPNDHPQMYLLWDAVAKTIQRSALLNVSTSVSESRTRISEIIGKEIDQSTTIFVPFHTNFGKHTWIGKNVFSIMLAAFWIWAA